jgi:hypothetical protein
MCTYIKQQTRKRTTIFFRSFDVNKINNLVITSNKLNNLWAMVTSGVGLDVACRPPVGHAGICNNKICFCCLCVLFKAIKLFISNFSGNFSVVWEHNPQL